MMTEICSTGKLPGKNLSVRKVVCLRKNVDAREVDRYTKHDMVQQLARAILDDESFIKVTSEEMFGEVMVEYRADCIVLTTDEYVQLRRDAFQAGVNHSRGISIVGMQL